MRVLVIGDTHFPFVHPMYRRFIQDMRNLYKPDRIVHVGDVQDQHAASPNYEGNPNGRSTGDEMNEALAETRKWHNTFRNVAVCIGNHDRRHIMAARKANLNDRYIRDYADVWETPTWDWRFSHRIDGVLYEHGTGTSGKNAAMNRAIDKRTSLVMGHTHTYAGVRYHANDTSIIFGLNVGCGIDIQAYAFEYGIDFAVRPVLGCGIITDGTLAQFIPMDCAKKYNRRRAKCS
jgi:predicted phosphodiesterase